MGTDSYSNDDGNTLKSEELNEVFVHEKRGVIEEFIEEEQESMSSGESITRKKKVTRTESMHTATTISDCRGGNDRSPNEAGDLIPLEDQTNESEPFLLQNGSAKGVLKQKSYDGEAEKTQKHSHGKKSQHNQEASDNEHHHHHHHHHHHGGEHNMRGVFLHILSDLFASVLVIITASAYVLMEKYGQRFGGREAKWLLYIDPMLSIVIVLIIVVPTYKLIREAAEILLNNAPGKISPHQFAKELSRQIPEVSSVHDLYLWNLTSDIIVATIHVVVKSNEKSGSGCQIDFERKFMDLSNKLNSFFQDYGINTTTIQIEFADPNGHANECCLRCSGEKEVSGVSNSGRKVSMNVKF